MDKLIAAGVFNDDHRRTVGRTPSRRTHSCIHRWFRCKAATLSCISWSYWKSAVKTGTSTFTMRSGTPIRGIWRHIWLAACRRIMLNMQWICEWNDQINFAKLPGDSNLWLMRKRLVVKYTTWKTVMSRNDSGRWNIIHTVRTRMYQLYIVERVEWLHFDENRWKILCANSRILFGSKV